MPRLSDAADALLVPASSTIDAGRPLLARLRVTLLPATRLTLPSHGGEAIHGLFLSLLAHRSPALASRLHDEQGRRAFSLSPLLGCYQMAGRSVGEPGAAIFFEVGLLGSELVVSGASALHDASAGGAELPLGRSTVTIKQVEPAASGPLVRYPEELVETAREDRCLAAEFLIPTAFKVRGRNYLFPHPELVFASLLDRWNAFSGVPLPPSLDASFGSVAVSRYRLHTEMVTFSRYKWIGFKGWATFLLPPTLPEEAVRALNCLADFAFYSGVGAKTAMGMGQCRRLSDARPLHH